ncbi:hypothetical protein GLOTRDRAFT_117498 [Gloeophyllum trabeum ATCC 11539]|uniref:Uncharacterized protein n=1 Tax=Gloeophyllum trabeum (strain ATCC 11539 / FP-39264 / Madison 617) TaxID=670483 RepID=S7PZ75_GLOTA|nr:uncharacterized protein GLOTRDRAFT_117498 [Gloeophyllum trabeum ATCC 11539]EPQ52793.1 hypothetical protein GLOTRDRAFT_117498 [Gloeophyllum trabeum ATCC 11539]
MSRTSKPLTLTRLNDVILGPFALVPPSETLDHLVRYLSTWSGSDKLLMIIDYTVKLLVPFLSWRARIQAKAGLRKVPASQAAQGLAKLGSLVGDARMLFRIWGLLPIVQWLISLERNPPPTRRLLTIERLQGWSMLLYYPLEHLYYLRAHEIIPATLPSLLSLFSSQAKPIEVNTNRVGMWSCRFWAVYVALQFAHLDEDRKLLRMTERSIAKSKGHDPAVEAERADLRKRWTAFRNELVANIGYLPLTLHWSLEQGLFSNEVWVGVFGLVAAIAGWRSGWQATALPSSTSSTSPPNPDAAIELEKTGGVPNLTEVSSTVGYTMTDADIAPAGLDEM